MATTKSDRDAYLEYEMEILQEELQKKKKIVK